MCPQIVLRLIGFSVGQSDSTVKQFSQVLPVRSFKKIIFLSQEATRARMHLDSKSKNVQAEEESLRIKGIVRLRLKMICPCK